MSLLISNKKYEIILYPDMKSLSEFFQINNSFREVAKKGSLISGPVTKAFTPLPLGLVALETLGEKKQKKTFPLLSGRATKKRTF